MARRNENLAYNYDRSYYQTVPAYVPQREQRTNPNLRVKVVKNTQPEKKVKVKYNYRAIAVLFVMVMCAFLVLCRGVMITDKTNQISEKKKELARIEAMNQKMQVEIDRSLDLSRVEQIADERLNMRRPEKYQMVYINLDRVDYVETSKGTSEAKDKFNGFFNSLKAYLD